MEILAGWGIAVPDAAAAWGPVGRGVLLGLGAALPIGPVNVEIARRVLRTGFAAGAALGAGAVTADVAYVGLSALSVVRVLDRPAVVLPLAGCGAALLAYLGVRSLQAAAAAWRHDPLDGAPHDQPHDQPVPDPPESPAAPPRVGGPQEARPSLGSAYAAGLLMTLLNPMTLAFWFTVVPAAGAAGDGANASAADDLARTCAGVFIGTAGWVVAYSGLLAGANRAAGRTPGRRRRWLAAADAVGGVALLGFAAAAAAGFWRRLSPLL